jgi:hypothetical protein
MKPLVQLLSATAPLRNPLALSSLKGRRRFFLLLLILSYCVLLPDARAVPITIRFFQSGFTGGGSVSGTLVGEDLNGDGIINGIDGEFSGGSVSFSGNSILPAFNWHGFAVGPILDLTTMRLQMWTEDVGGLMDIREIGNTTRFIPLEIQSKGKLYLPLTPMGKSLSSQPQTRRLQRCLTLVPLHLCWHSDWPD